MQTSITTNATVAGISFAQTRSVSSEAAVAQERTIPAAQSGSLTTRTSVSVGTITMTSGAHTITSAARVDLYWTVAGVKGCRRGVLVGTVATTAVPFTGGSGDDLPANLSAVTVALPVSLAVALVGNKLKSLLFGAPEAQTQFVLCSTGNVEELAKNLPQGAVEYWDAGQLGNANPLTGDTITNMFVSHADATAAKKVQFVAQFDN